MDEPTTKQVAKKVSLEQKALIRFKEVATTYHPDRWFTGQALPNRVPQTSTGFQFGDLRVDLEDRYVVVEVESAGGVTNLAKYWYLLAKHIVDKPIILFHIFAQSSKDDYRSHFNLWDFLSTQMHDALGDELHAVRYTYHNDAELEQVVATFEQELKQVKEGAE